MMALMISVVPLATLTTLQKVELVAVIVVGVGGLVIAAVNAWLAIANERKRTQPIVIASQDGPRRSIEHSNRSAFDVYMTNEGTGAAFNVRFGVELHGVRIPYKHDPNDPYASVYPIVKPGQRLPGSSWPLEFDRLYLLSKIADPDVSSMFWARYENAQGKLWETRNPGNRSGRLGIKRVRAVRLRERREEHKRKTGLKQAIQNERTAVAGLQPQLPPEQPTE